MNFFQSSEDSRRIEKNSAAFLLAMYTFKKKSVAKKLPIKIKLYKKLKTKTIYKIKNKALHKIKNKGLHQIKNYI